jgi:hypothetical protein
MHEHKGGGEGGGSDWLRAGESGDRIVVGSCGPPSLLYNGYRVVFLRVKRPWHGIDHPLPSSAEVKETVEV